MSAQSQHNTTSPGIVLLSSHMAFPMTNDHNLIERVAGQDETAAKTDIKLTWDVKTPHRCLGNLHFSDHQIKLTAVSSPLSAPLVDRTINVSCWQPQIKALMRQHRSHLVCAYQGTHPDPVEKMIALYRVASALQHDGLVAVANEPAWTAHPAADLLTPEKIEGYRHEIPFILWFGYVKFFVDKQNFWLATKGHHLFDVPDLASFVPSEAYTQDIMNLFINVFYYLYHNDGVVAAGDTMEIRGSQDYLRFSEVTENEQYLMGPSGTLVLERISPDKINPPTRGSSNRPQSFGSSNRTTNRN